MAIRDKVAIITGAARGHGRSIAVTFASEGAKLALVDVAPMDQVVGDCQQHEVDVMAIQTDLRDPDQVKAMVEQVHARYGRIDILINDAGIVTHFRYAGTQRWPRIADMPPEFFDKVMRTNLFGTYLTTHFTLPYMEAQGGGHIVNFGQGNVGRGVRNAPGEYGAAVYHVSKVAIRAFSQEVAAEEAAHHICIVSFGPGGPGEAERTARGQELTPEEVSALAGQVDMQLGRKVVMAAEAPMELSGRMVAVRDGQLVPAADEVSK